MDIVGRQSEYTMVVGGEDSKNLLSREDLQWLSTVLLAACWQMSYYILTSISHFFTERMSVVYLGFLTIHIMCAGIDYSYLYWGASHLHVSFSITPEN